MPQRALCTDLGTILRNKNSVLNMSIFIMVWGGYITLGNVLTPLFDSQFTPTQISIIGVIFVLTGVIGCFLMGLYIDKTQMHLRAIRILCSCLCVLYFTAIFLLPIGNLYVTCAVCFFAGMLNVPILPSTYAFATKIDSSVP